MLRLTTSPPRIRHLDHRYREMYSNIVTTRSAHEGPMKSNEGLCARCGAARHQDSLSACAFPRSCVIRRNRFSLARVKGTSNVCASVKTPSVSRDEPASGVLLKRKRLRSKHSGRDLRLLSAGRLLRSLSRARVLNSDHRTRGVPDDLVIVTVYVSCRLVETAASRNNQIGLFDVFRNFADNIPWIAFQQAY